MCSPLKDLEETVEAFSFILERTQQRTDVFSDAMDATEETMPQLFEELDGAMTATGCGRDSGLPRQSTQAQFGPKCGADL